MKSHEKSDRRVRAMLPGSFDPPTNGHVNMIERASRLFDSVVVVVADNISKKCLFSADERVAMLTSILKGLSNVEVVVWNGLIVDYARQSGISVMIRGVRALVDFGYEFELAMTNKQLYPDLKVVFLPTDPKYFVLRSSAIKEMAAFGADIGKMVPKIVAEKLAERIKMLT